MDLGLRVAFAVDGYRNLVERASRHAESDVLNTLKGASRRCGVLETRLSELKRGDLDDSLGQEWIKAVSPDLFNVEQLVSRMERTLLNTETETVIREFQAVKIPDGPFPLASGTVLDPSLFRKALEGDIQAGPRGARWRTGALLADLRALVVPGGGEHEKDRL